MLHFFGTPCMFPKSMILRNVQVHVCGSEATLEVQADCAQGSTQIRSPWILFLFPNAMGNCFAAQICKVDPIHWVFNL